MHRVTAPITHKYTQFIPQTYAEWQWNIYAESINHKYAGFILHINAKSMPCKMHGVHTQQDCPVP